MLLWCFSATFGFFQLRHQGTRVHAVYASCLSKKKRAMRTQNQEYLSRELVLLGFVGVRRSACLFPTVYQSRVQGRVRMLVYPFCAIYIYISKDSPSTLGLQSLRNPVSWFEWALCGCFSALKWYLSVVRAECHLSVKAAFVWHLVRPRSSLASPASLSPCSLPLRGRYWALAAWHMRAWHQHWNSIVDMF